MKKAIIVLVMIIGIFTSCEQESILDDCGCIKTVYQEFATQQPEPTYIITNEDYVECQEESRIETEGTTIEVRCNFVNIIK
tara:strand:+ start:418 stop:660 length:243 start_codon:yes stop_codon:yes gene_type:complete